MQSITIVRSQTIFPLAFCSTFLNLFFNFDHSLNSIKLSRQQDASPMTFRSRYARVRSIFMTTWHDDDDITRCKHTHDQMINWTFFSDFFPCSCSRESVRSVHAVTFWNDALLTSLTNCAWESKFVSISTVLQVKFRILYVSVNTRIFPQIDSQNFITRQSEASNVLQTKPHLALQVTEAIHIIPPTPVEVQRAVDSSLNDCCVPLAEHLESLLTSIHPMCAGVVCVQLNVVTILVLFKAVWFTCSYKIAS